MNKSVMHGEYHADDGVHGWDHRLVTDPHGPYFYLQIEVREWGHKDVPVYELAHCSLGRDQAIELMNELEIFIHRTAEDKK